MNEERFSCLFGPVTAVARWRLSGNYPLHALDRYQAKRVLSDLRSSQRVPLLLRLYQLVTGVEFQRAPRMADLNRAVSALESAVDEGRLLFVGGWGPVGREPKDNQPRSPSDVALSAAVRGISDQRGGITFAGRRYLFVERLPGRQLILRQSLTRLDPASARTLLAQIAEDPSKTDSEKEHLAVVLEAFERPTRSNLRFELYVSQRSIGAKADSGPGDNGQEEQPIKAGPPPPRFAPAKPPLGTLALVLDVLAEDPHDKPVYFELEASDGSVHEKRFVTDDKIIAHDRIELRWHDLPEDVRYTLRVKQADGDVEVLFSNVPFAELSGHTDDMEAGQPHTPVEVER